MGKRHYWCSIAGNACDMQRGETMAKFKENKEFRILSAIGIILVVAGHLGYELFDISGNLKADGVYQLN